MGAYRKPVEEAIDVFLKIKMIIDEFEERISVEKKSNELKTLKSKLRSRAREIPEMITTLGIVPTLSFCLAKSERENLKKILALLEGGDEKAKEDLYIKISKGEGLEGYSYALYTYVILKYLSDYLGSLKYDEGGQKEVKLDLRELTRNERAWNTIYEYLEALTQRAVSMLASQLLQPYLIQFKRLCEAEFPPER